MRTILTAPAGVVLKDTSYASWSQLFGMNWNLSANIGALLLTYGVVLSLNFLSLCFLKRKYSARS